VKRRILVALALTGPLSVVVVSRAGAATQTTSPVGTSTFTRTAIVPKSPTSIAPRCERVTIPGAVPAALVFARRRGPQVRQERGRAVADRRPADLARHVCLTG
jgi:hypothetical protein